MQIKLSPGQPPARLPALAAPSFDAPIIGLLWPTQPGD